MVLCQKKETEVVNFVRKDDHLVVHRAQHHMPHGGGGRRAGRVPVLRFRGAAARGAPVCSVSRRARVGGPRPGASRAGLAGVGVFPGERIPRATSARLLRRCLPVRGGFYSVRSIHRRAPISMPPPTQRQRRPGPTSGRSG